MVKEVRTLSKGNVQPEVLPVKKLLKLNVVELPANMVLTRIADIEDRQEELQVMYNKLETKKVRLLDRATNEGIDEDAQAYIVREIPEVRRKVITR